jgi:hypothetical protein
MKFKNEENEESGLLFEDLLADCLKTGVRKSIVCDPAKYKKKM